MCSKYTVQFFRKLIQTKDTKIIYKFQNYMNTKWSYMPMYFYKEINIWICCYWCINWLFNISRTLEELSNVVDYLNKEFVTKDLQKKKKCNFASTWKSISCPIIFSILKQTPECEARAKYFALAVRAN